MLRMWGTAQAYCKSRQREVDAFRELLEQARKTRDDMSALRIPTTPADAVVRQYQDVVRAWERDISEALRVYRLLDEIVGALPSLQQRVTRERYQKGYSWTKVGFRCNIAADHARRLERQVVTKIARLVDKQ